MTTEPTTPKIEALRARKEELRKKMNALARAEARELAALKRKAESERRKALAALGELVLKAAPGNPAVQSVLEKALAGLPAASEVRALVSGHPRPENAPTAP